MVFLARRPPALRVAPLLRPLRLPRLHAIALPSQPRLFTQNHPLLLLTRTSSPRPQLPYLSQPSRHAALPRGPAFQRQIARLLTTENRRHFKQQFWIATKYSALGWFMLFLLAMAYNGWQQELVERDHPSPQEWSYFTRTAFRQAYMRMDPDFDGSGFTDWAAVGSELRHALERLENLSGDGRGLVSVAADGPDQEPLMVAGVGPAGYDISAKSYPWRQGYFEVVMACARAAEFLDDMVRDKARRLVFPKDVVIGPSNPDPRPVPPGAAAAPLEENCDRPYAPPETFYLRVLTGAGFSTRQRMDAALAYANWLEFKGLQGSAEETYRWALDIAASALPDPNSAVDAVSGIVKLQDAAPPSDNLLRAATSLASHHARAGNVTSALPVFLSVLRARRAAPVDPAAAYESPSVTRTASSNTDYGRVLSMLGSIIRSSEYPTELSSGDEPFLRPSVTEPDCTEAELMLYIGEILFATSSSRPDEGLGWTKQAVDMAERGFRDRNLPNEQRQTCKACLETGVTNWALMIKKLLNDERTQRGQASANTGWKSWFGRSDQTYSARLSKWAEEAKTVEDLRMKLIREGISEKLASAKSAPGSVWIG
ncbi:hypothetical protein MBLNU459_g2401t2 [Dothideomycetes sp. NU459]